MSRVWSFGSVGALLCGGAFLGLAIGCKRRPAPPEPAGVSEPRPSPSALVSALPQTEEPSRCRRLPGWALTLEADAGAGEKQRSPAEDEDDDALLPFGVDVGAAVPTAAGFAVAGLRGGGHAFVAVLGETASRRVDLGELHGDAETPAIAVAGERVLVALRTSDAAGFTIKLGSVPLAAGDVEWGHELTKLGKGVTGLELAANGGGGVLVFQSDEKGSSRLLLGSFSSGDLKEAFDAKPLEVKDAEMPRLVARPGGYWLSWVRSLPEPKKVPSAAPKASAGPDTDPEERELLDVGLRVVEVALLDEQGKLMGAAKRVGEPRRQVLLYDVALLASGGLLVATRSDATAPGAEGGALLLSEVGADGSVHAEQLEDDDIGAGAPTLLVDRDPKLAGPWLSVSAPTDATRIGLVQGAKTRLWADPALGHAEIAAVSGGHFLTQRARGRGVSLDAVDCAWPSEPVPEKK